MAMSPVRPGRTTGPVECFGASPVGYLCSQHSVELPCEYWQLLHMSTPGIVGAQRVGGRDAT
eukprot:8323062-Pyramimonas_sp.AAC.1